MSINADKPHLWKGDTNASVDQFNHWFMKFAPKAFRDTKKTTIGSVEQGLLLTNDLTRVTTKVIKAHPSILSMLRMATCPPLARDRLVGLAQSTKNFVETLERGNIPRHLSPELLEEHLTKITRILSKMLDIDISHGLWSGVVPPKRNGIAHRQSLQIDYAAPSLIRL